MSGTYRWTWRRLIYIVVVYLLAPLVPLYLLWRSRRQPAYRLGWGERFAWSYRGLFAHLNAPRRIWVHAVSLGETRAAKPLLDALFQSDPSVHVILTHTTPTGRAAGQELFATLMAQGRMTQVYVPYDLPDVLIRFLNHFKPTDCWLMETEIWPNTIAACQQRDIPVSLINGRLSDKTLRQTMKYPFIAQLAREAYGGLSHVCAQSLADAQRYEQVGVPSTRLSITGNLKFDMRVDDAQVQYGVALKSLQTQRPIVLLASTRDGEEAMWLEALSKSHMPNVQWWVVPRHPQRFDEVAQLLQQAGFSGSRLLRKSALNTLAEVDQCAALQRADVVLGDTLGEMFAYYVLADVVLMGGAWQNLGGQNFLEPLALGRPTWIGPHTFNFAQATTDAVAEGALIQVDTIEQALVQVVTALTQPDYLQVTALRAQTFIEKHQGAVGRTLEAVWR